MIVVKIANDSETDAAAAVDTIKAAGVSSLDVVIANSGIAGKFARLEDVNMNDFKEFFEVNTFSVVRLFVAVYQLRRALVRPSSLPSALWRPASPSSRTTSRLCSAATAPAKPP